jgi:hypothetical protein
MMRMFPTMERKNHLYKEDVGVDPAEGEGGGDGGDDEDVPHHGEEEDHEQEYYTDNLKKLSLKRYL